MENEIWKNVKGYEGIYEISNMGRLKSHYTVGRKSHGDKSFEKIIKPAKCTNGYLEYHLCKKGKRKVVLAHRLVAEHFIDNPNNLPQVNHIDEDITNNCVENLEWVTPKQNANHGTRNERCANAQKIKVVQLDLEGNFIRLWNGFKDIERELNVGCENIIRVCKGKYKTSCGYIWKYYDDYLNMITLGEV